MGIGVERLATAYGAGLAAAVAQAAAGLDSLSDAERLELVAATARLDAWSAAVRAAAVAAVFASAREEQAAEAAELAARAGVAAPVVAAPVVAPIGSHSEAAELERFLHRRVGAEVSLVLGISAWAADREVDLALDLVAHPPLRRALAEGRCDRAQALVLLEGVRDVGDPAAAGRVLASLLGPDDGPEGDDFDPDEPAYDEDASGQPVPMVAELCPDTRPDATLWGLVPGRLRAVLAREVVRVDPAAAAEQARRNRSDRRVVFDPQPDFMAELHLRTGAEAAGAAFTNLDRTARAARRAGDARNLDQLRADIAIGWLTEGAHGTYVTRPAPPPDPITDAANSNAANSNAANSNAANSNAANSDAADPVKQVCLPRPRGPLVHLSVAATTMLGLDAEPGVLHGPTGPVPVPDQIARAIAHEPGARWRRLLYDPATGIAADLSPTYRPPEPMNAFVRARDGHQSRLPTSCATHLELDHVHAYDHARPERGGQTTSPNLASAGRRDHQLKTDQVLTVTGNANQALTITTPSGRSYLTYPHPYANPQPHQWPRPVDYTGPPPY